MFSLSQDLVRSLIPSITESSNSRLSDHLSSKVRSQIKADKYGGTRKEWSEVSQSIMGLAEAGRIRVQEDLAEGLEKNLSNLNRHREQGKNVWEEDVPIKMDNLPQHVQFLVSGRLSVIDLANPLASVHSAESCRETDISNAYLRLRLYSPVHANRTHAGAADLPADYGRRSF